MKHALKLGAILAFSAALAGLVPGTAEAQYTWSQVNTDGFGDTANFSAFSMAVFNGAVHAGTHNTPTGCEVFRYDGPTPSDWVQVNTDGFGDANNDICLAMEVYNNRLYAATRNRTDGCEVWEYDGANWGQVNTNGFGDPEVESAWAMTVFDGMLWLSTGDWTVNNAEVWAYDGSTWTKMNNDGFGDPDNRAVRSLAVYNASLYAGSYKQNAGGQLWRYDGPTAADWTLIGTGGFGDVGNYEVRSMAEYGGNLILGTSNLDTGLQVWRYDGASLTQIDPDTMQYDSARSMVVAPAIDRLYVGTGNDVGEPSGTQIWEYDGSTWTQVNTNGFGDLTNEAAHSMLVFDAAVWVGVANGDSLGAKVFRTEDVPVELKSLTVE